LLTYLGTTYQDAILAVLQLISRNDARLQC